MAMNENVVCVCNLFFLQLYLWDPFIVRFIYNERISHLKLLLT